MCPLLVTQWRIHSVPLLSFQTLNTSSLSSSFHLLLSTQQCLHPLLCPPFMVPIPPDSSTTCSYKPFVGSHWPCNQVQALSSLSQGPCISFYDIPSLLATNPHAASTFSFTDFPTSLPLHMLLSPAAHRAFCLISWNVVKVLPTKGAGRRGYQMTASHPSIPQSQSC